MYIREIQQNCNNPIENGMPVQGTWTRAFDEVDLSGVQRPYSVPLPGWMKNSRIKEWESFFIQDDRYFIHARFCNMKYYLSAYVDMYDRQNGDRHSFHK